MTFVYSLTVFLLNSTEGKPNLVNFPSATYKRII